MLVKSLTFVKSCQILSNPDSCVKTCFSIFFLGVSIPTFSFLATFALRLHVTSCLNSSVSCLNHAKKSWAKNTKKHPEVLRCPKQLFWVNSCSSPPEKRHVFGELRRLPSASPPATAVYSWATARMAWALTPKAGHGRRRNG